MLLINVHCINIFLWISFSSGILSNRKSISSVSSLRFLFLGCNNVGLRDLTFTKLAYTEKQSTFWCQKCTKTAYTQKHQKSRTLCGTDWHGWIGFWFFDFLVYIPVLWLFLIKMIDLFEYLQVLCTFAIKMLIVFEFMQVWGIIKPASTTPKKKSKTNSSMPVSPT